MWDSMNDRWWQWPANQRRSGSSPKVVPTITAGGSCWTTQSPVFLTGDCILYISHTYMSQPITAHCCWTVVSPLSPDRRLYFLQQPITAQGCWTVFSPLSRRQAIAFLHKWPITALTAVGLPCQSLVIIDRRLF